MDNSNKAKTAHAGKPEESRRATKNYVTMPFTRVNFYMMGACVIMIIVGFILISGGGSNDGSFNPEIFSTRRLVVGPAITFLGFLLMAFAIIYKPKTSKTDK